MCGCGDSGESGGRLQIPFSSSQMSPAAAAADDDDEEEEEGFRIPLPSRSRFWGEIFRRGSG